MSPSRERVNVGVPGATERSRDAVEEKELELEAAAEEEEEEVAADDSAAEEDE